MMILQLNNNDHNTLNDMLNYYKSYEDGINSLNMANQAISKGRLEGDIPSVLEEITRFNFNWMNEIRKNYNNKDFGYVFEKYINN
mgnify:CR=1 FL=1